MERRNSGAGEREEEEGGGRREEGGGKEEKRVRSTMGREWSGSGSHYRRRRKQVPI